MLVSLLCCRRKLTPDAVVYKRLIDSVYENSLLRTPKGLQRESRKELRHDELFRLYLVFQEMRIVGAVADVAAYNTLINACAGAGDVERAKETMEAMQNEGIVPDVITYTSLIKACGIHGGEQMIAFAEEIFDSMQQRTNHFSSYIEPTELTFQRLIQCHLRCDRSSVNTPRIWALLDDMIERGLRPGLNTLRSCVKAACIEGDVSKALGLLMKIRYSTRLGFDFKSWKLVAALCRTKQLYDDEEALNLTIEEKRSELLAG
jgi:pentatricopeptide repeat protein